MNPFFLNSGARVFCAVLLSLLSLASLYAIADHAHFGPWVGDYLAFWVAAQAFLAGTAPQLYDAASFSKMLTAAYPGYGGLLGWFYPPSVLLLIAPLGMLPFLPGLLLFEGGGLLALYMLMRKILPSEGTLRPLAFLLSSPAVWINIITGQNGLLTAALAGASLLTHPSHAMRSGILLGLLSIKPQLALVFGVLYLFSAQRRAFCSALGTAVVMLLAGCWLSGVTVPTWLGSLHTASVFAGTRITATQTSLFGMLKLLGMDDGWAYGLHACGALLALIHAVRVWRSTANEATKYGVACIATLLFSPYLLFYDEVWWVLIAAFLAASRPSLNPSKKVLAALCWIYPALPSLFSAVFIHIQLTPILMMLALFLFPAGKNTAPPVVLSPP